jgi:hypothetical protein
MAAVGGSIQGVSIDGREFVPTADAEANLKLGGFENETQANGDGTARLVKTRVPWSLTGISYEIDDTRGDQEFLQALADGKRFFNVAISLASGTVYQGKGQLIGELQAGTKNASASFDLSGPQKLTAQ